MATFANILKGTDETDLTAYTTASGVLAANKLNLIFVWGRPNSGIGSEGVPSSVVRGSINFTLIASLVYGDSQRAISLWRAVDSTGSTGTVVITFPSQQARAHWIWDEGTNTDISGTNGSGAIIQSVTNQAAFATSVTATLAALASASNYAYSGGTDQSNTFGITPGTGFTELADQAGASFGDIQTQYKQNETNVSISVANNTNLAIIAIEIKDGSGAAATSKPFHRSSTRSFRKAF